ncbi:MAG: hypothetical protein ABJE66_04335 [Deltaproteobacteria bacterium]
MFACAADETPSSDCPPDDAESCLAGDDSDGKADGTATVGVSDDALNGLWNGTQAGTKLTDDLVIESWPAVGIQMTIAGKPITFTRSGDTLTSPNGTLSIIANGKSPADDVIDGSIDGVALHLTRDTTPKPTITLKPPGDRPYRMFLTDMILPAAQLDRESYKIMHSSDVGTFLRSCELYKHGSWQRKYMKGATWSEQSASLSKVIGAINNVRTTPHNMTRIPQFFTTLTANLKDPSLAGLAISTFGMYFSTGAGGSLHIPITSDSTAYFITDKPSRSQLIGVVAMATPTHGPLASTFGRQLLDLGAAPAADSAAYARAMMALLVKSDTAPAQALSGTGRSALTDWFAVMAIEDYRGVAFGEPGLGWGYNMTQVQFYGLIARALARPGAVDAMNQPVIGQVVVGSQLEPGDPSYADVLNNGNDMQEYPDMASLKQLATSYLLSTHPDLIAAVKAQLSWMPANEVDYRAANDIFHYIGSELYDGQARFAGLNGAKADAVAASVVKLFDTLDAETAQFEAYILAHGYTKSSTPAPKSKGF